MNTSHLHEKKSTEFLLNPSLWMDVRLGHLKKTSKLTGGNRSVVPKDNAMNVIHGLQRNQTKLCYEELAHHYS